MCFQSVHLNDADKTRMVVKTDGAQDRADERVA